MSKALDEMEKTADELIAKSLKTDDELEKSDKDKEELESDDIVEDSDEDDSSEDDEDDEDEDDEDDEDDDEDDEDEEDDEIKKSFLENEVIQESINVSDFLMAMAEVMANSASTMNKSLKTSATENTTTLETMVKSFQAISQMTQGIQAQVEANNSAVQDVLVKSIESVMERLDEVCDRLEGMEAQPVGMRKSINNANGMRYQDKDFQKSLGSAPETLSKSQVSDALTTLSMQGAGVPVTAVVAFESSGYLSPELEAKVQNYYKK